MYSLITPRSTLIATSTGARAAAAASSRRNSTRHYSSTMHDNDPEVLEREKRRNLSGQQHKTSTPHSFAPGWNEDLASASEASVKADKSTGSTSELQAQTIEYIRSRHASDDRMEPTMADYVRDEVTGPLSGAKGVEDVEDVVNKRKTVLKKTVHDETTEVLRGELNPTRSEENVKADRGEI